ncbi:MAG: ribonuclease R [marine benthic group bacterium]|nr:ribonuclease R [Gemmatimonadota bacterium]
MPDSPVTRQQVLTYLTDHPKRPLTARELARALGVDSENYRSFRRLLREMEGDALLFRQRKGRFGLPAQFEAASGRLQVTRSGDGFVIPDDAGSEDVFVPARDLETAQDGDRVVVRIDRRPRGRNPEGRIVRVLERAVSQVVGIYHRQKGQGYVVAQEPPLTTDVLVPQDRSGGAEAGQVVLVEIEDWGARGPRPIGRVTRILGRPEEPGVAVLSILFGHQLPLEFPDRVEREAERIARRGIRPEDLDGREDFRDQLVYTIDPADARDHDDAVSVRELDDGTLEVGVHIADVSFYVKRGSAVDREGAERATSVYLVDRVVPMLPEALSNSICSLVPGEDRLVVSVLFRVDGEGRVGQSRIVRGVIRSAHRLSYEQAQSRLDGAAAGRLDQDPLTRSLQQLSRFAGNLRDARFEAGAIDFAMPEAKVELDERGEPVAIAPRERLEAHRLIEDLMILANETIARLGEEEDLPILFRNHEPPSEDRLEGLRSLARLLGHPLPEGQIRPRDIADLVESQSGTRREYLVSVVALRSMKQARYSGENHGHFGLASEAYSHFTSPIRRYPDLHVHRVVTGWIEGRAGRSRLTRDDLETIARHCSVRERRAEAAERESIELMTIRYMERHLGDEFEGTISGVTGFGLFVMMDEVLAEGLIRVSSLVDDYYVFDAETFTLTGRGSRRRLRLGDRVRVQVVRVDPENREIDLDLLDGPLDPGRGSG